MPHAASRCYLTITLQLIGFASLATPSWAGSLSGVREAVRRPARSSNVSAQDDEEPQEGKLSRVREQVRRASPPADRVTHEDAARRKRKRAQRRRRNHSHRRVRGAGCWDGMFTLSHATHGWCYEPIAPTLIYAAPPLVTPVAPAPPAYALPPTVYAAPPATEQLSIQPITESIVKSFAAFPFADGAEGFFVYHEPSPNEGGLAKHWLGKLQVELADASGRVDRTGIAFLLEGDHGFGFDFDWNSYTEQLPGGGHDELNLGRLNLLYRIVETDRALVRAGVGVGWLDDQHGTDAGLNLTLQSDLLLSRNWVGSAELDFGTLGDAQTLHAAGTVGRRFGRCEVYGGYDYRRVGAVDLQGPTVGLRVWW